jgi:hypothetical protein
MLWHAFLFLGLLMPVGFPPPFSFILLGGFHLFFLVRNLHNVLNIYVDDLLI